MSKTRSILAYLEAGLSQNKICKTLKTSKRKIAEVKAAAAKVENLEEKLEQLDDEELEKLLFPRKEFLNYQKPNYEKVHKELLKPGVNLRLLHQEYLADCRSKGAVGYQYTQFRMHYHDYVKENGLIQHLNHKPGEEVMVDWAGTKMTYYDPISGHEKKADLFVSVLPFSNYCFAKVCTDAKEENWINAHVDMFNYFDGVPAILIPDNLKTGVVSHPRHEDPILNRSYEIMADYYDITVMPTRVRRPQDKASVENTVGFCSTWIIAKNRNRQFLSFEELDKAVADSLEELNDKPFQKKAGSRRSVFLEEEKGFLRPLPPYPFEFTQIRTVTVPRNYHVNFENQHYSVPYTFAGKQVEIRANRSNVSIYYAGKEIASHQRLQGEKDQYATVVDHQPLNHQYFSSWEKDDYMNWASEAGENTIEVFTRLMEGAANKKQAYPKCLSIVKLGEKFSVEEIEMACKIGLETEQMVSCKVLKKILLSGLAKVKDDCSDTTVFLEDTSFALLRGESYYAD